jgi:hypothetical protein
MDLKETRGNHAILNEMGGPTITVMNLWVPQQQHT